MSQEELTQDSTQLSLRPGPTLSHWVFPLFPLVPTLALFYHCLSKRLAFNKRLGGMSDKESTKCIEQSCLREDSSIRPVSSMSWEADVQWEKPQVLNSGQGSNSLSTLAEWCPLPGISVVTCEITLLGDQIISGPQSLSSRSTASPPPSKCVFPTPGLHCDSVLRLSISCIPHGL